MLESIKCSTGGAYYVRGAWVNADADAPAALAAQGFDAAAVADAPKGTMAYGILTAHNTSGDDQNLKIKFDAMASHDITFVGTSRRPAHRAWKSSPSRMCSPTATTACAP